MSLTNWKKLKESVYKIIKALFIILRNCKQLYGSIEKGYKISPLGSKQNTYITHAQVWGDPQYMAVTLKQGWLCPQEILAMSGNIYFLVVTTEAVLLVSGMQKSGGCQGSCNSQDNPSLPYNPLSMPAKQGIISPQMLIVLKSRNPDTQ